MLNLPTEIMVLMQPFAPVFSERTWDWVQVLVVGAILAPGKRTVTAVLRVMGLSEERWFQRCRGYLNPVTYVSRLRLDSALHDWPGPQPKGKRGPKPKKGRRQPSLTARLTDPAVDPRQFRAVPGSNRTCSYFGGCLA